MKIFIAGGTGFLGSELSQKLREKNIVLIGSRQKKSKIKLDLSLKNNFNKLIKFDPDVIINCAALTDVDKCEKNKNLAHKTNIVITKNLVLIAQKLNCKFIQISTDHVYDNPKNKNVENKINLRNYYSLSKRISEIEALKYNKSLILRTNFFGVSNNGNGNLNWFFDSIKKKQIITLFNDVYFSPIYIKTLCGIINKIVKKNIYGIFNLGSINAITKEKFFLMISKKKNLDIKFKSMRLKSVIKKSKFVKRPKQMGMNVKKFQSKFKINLPSIDQEVQKFCNEYKN